MFNSATILASFIMQSLLHKQGLPQSVRENLHCPLWCISLPTEGTPLIFNSVQLLSRSMVSDSLWSHGLAVAAAAKSLQSCPTLCDPMDSSPPGSPVPGILQARTLEWVAISFSNAWKRKVIVKSLSRVRLLATPWTAAFQAPPSMGFSRQEYWSGVPLPSPPMDLTLLNSCCSSPTPPRLEGNSLIWLVDLKETVLLYWTLPLPFLFGNQPAHRRPGSSFALRLYEKDQLQHIQWDRNSLPQFQVWYLEASLVAQTVKHLSTMQETRVWSLGWEDPLEKEMAIHSRTIAWKIPWTEEPGTGHGVEKSRTQLSNFTSPHSEAKLPAGISLIWQDHLYWKLRSIFVCYLSFLLFHLKSFRIQAGKTGHYLCCLFILPIKGNLRPATVMLLKSYTAAL